MKRSQMSRFQLVRECERLDQVVELKELIIRFLVAELKRSR